MSIENIRRISNMGDYKLLATMLTHPAVELGVVSFNVYQVWRTHQDYQELGDDPNGV